MAARFPKIKDIDNKEAVAIARDVYKVSDKFALAIATASAMTAATEQSLMDFVAVHLAEFDDEGVAGDYNGAEFASDCQYQGFDPRALFRVFMKAMDTWDNKNDIYHLIQIGLERGNNVDNMQKTSSDAFRTKLLALKTKYNLKAKAGNNRYALTLSRVCALFPVVSCSYMKFCKNSTVPKAVMESISPGYPAIMMCGAFASLILAWADKLADAYLLFAYQFNEVINRKRYAKGRPSEGAICADLIKYMDAARNSDWIPNDKRWDCMTAWSHSIILHN